MNILDGSTLRHSARCTRPRVTSRPASTRPGWAVQRCECCHAIAVVKAEPTLDLDDGPETP